MTQPSARKRSVGRPVGSDRAENTRRILDAGLAAFAARGYAGTHFADIGSAVGFSRSALYQYFPNKKALYLALLEDIQAQHIDTLKGIMAGEGEFADKLEAILAVFVADHEFDFNRSTFLAAVPLELRRHPELVEPALAGESVPDLLMAFFAEAVEQGELVDDFSPEDLCLAFLGGLLGMSLFQHNTGIGEVSGANGVINAMLRGALVNKR